MSAHRAFDVRYVAKLARLALSEDEAVLIQSQLQEVLGYVEKLQSVDISSLDHEVQPPAHAAPLRADRTQPGLDRATVLDRAPARTADQFLVTRVVES
jgi:aspartyl-tRNA(Asn)/glutamyl-tRNA(Gln) amidotransferase subunit C